MHLIVGTWDVSLKTPIGTLSAVYVFTDDDGVLAGTASTQSGECASTAMSAP